MKGKDKEKLFTTVPVAKAVVTLAVSTVISQLITTKKQTAGRNDVLPAVLLSVK